MKAPGLEALRVYEGGSREGRKPLYAQTTKKPAKSCETWRARVLLGEKVLLIYSDSRLISSHFLVFGAVPDL